MRWRLALGVALDVDARGQPVRVALPAQRAPALHAAAADLLAAGVVRERQRLRLGRDRAQREQRPVLGPALHRHAPARRVLALDNPFQIAPGTYRQFTQPSSPASTLNITTKPAQAGPP